MHNWDDPATWSILLVDDEIDNLEVVAETLEFYGATVKSASNGNSALDLLKSFSPTIVVTDLSMPGMDGWQLRGRIKILPNMQNVPIIALSAHAMVGDKERALDAGFDGYLTKPINVPTLLEDMRIALKEKESGVLTPTDAFGVRQDSFEVSVPTLAHNIPISISMPLGADPVGMTSSVSAAAHLDAVTPNPSELPEPSTMSAAPSVPASDTTDQPKPAVNGNSQRINISNEEKTNS